MEILKHNINRGVARGRTAKILIGGRRRLSLEHQKFKFKKEGAQIYGEKTMGILLYKMGMTQVGDSSWNKREVQDHFVIPEIGQVVSGAAFDGVEPTYLNEDQNATITFWLSLIERTSLSSVYMDVRDSFDSKTGKPEIKKVRVSRYLISIDGLIGHLEFIGGKIFKKDQKRNIKKSFIEFVESIRNYSETTILRERVDTKGNIENLSIEIATNRYFQVNEFLYDRAINKSKNDFRSIKNSIAVFITIMRAAKKRILKGVIDSEASPEIKVKKMKLISGKDFIPDKRAFLGLSYKTIESNVCFRYIGSIAESLGLNRKTVSNQIQFLSKYKIISYVVVREWSNSTEIYFMTDSFSELYLSDYLLNKYRSNYCYDVVEISSVYGRAYSLDSSNKPSETYDKVDITSEKFKRARIEFEEKKVG